MESYLVVDGQKFDLTKEEFEKISATVDFQKKKVFNIERGKEYYYIDDRGGLYLSRKIKHEGDDIDKARALVGNMCANYEIMKKRANYEAFERILWRYSEEHGGCGKFYPCWTFEHGWDYYYTTEAHCLGPSFVSAKVVRDAIECGKKWLQSVGLTENDIFY